MRTSRATPVAEPVSPRIAEARRPVFMDEDRVRGLVHLGRVEGFAVAVKWLMWGMRNS